MNFATILEAYGSDSIEKNKKKKKDNIVIDNNIDNNTNNNEQDLNYQIHEYKKDFEHCEPIQPPHYKLPISENVLKNYNNAYQNFLKDRKVSEYKNNNDKLKNNTISLNNSNINNKNKINIYENYDKIRLENVDNIEPYFDEELDNYLNVNDFTEPSFNNKHEDNLRHDYMNKK